MEDEDKKKELDTPLPSEEKSKADPEDNTDPEKDKKPEDEKDIDFEAQAKELEGKDPKKQQRTPAEEAAFNLKKNADRVKELGGDPAKVLGFEPASDRGSEFNNSDFLTKADMARERIRGMAKSDAEARVILWHYQNSIQKSGDIGNDVENAYLLAHKPSLVGKFQSITRAKENIPPRGPEDTAGQKPKVSAAPRLAEDEERRLLTSGYRLVKPGLYEGKFMVVRHNGTEWVKEKKAR
jgi:hypothetical protein